MRRTTTVTTGCLAPVMRHCLSTPSLGQPVLEPRTRERWTVPCCGPGWNEATPAAFYVGRGRHELG